MTDYTQHIRRDVPLVAVTATTRVTEGAPRVRLNEAYVRALEAAGVAPLVVPPLSEPRASAAGILDVVAGLVLTGGEDVDPALYDAEPHPELGPVHRPRDETELALLEVARSHRVPTLAICRGLQIVNVGLGGTLIQDIAAQCAAAGPHERADARTARVHEVRVDESARLAAALGTCRLAVNSVHHQAVDRPGDPLRVTARAPDGIVEGLESTDAGWWMVAVQWHPEELTTTPEPWDRRLFAAFAAACRASR